jgi:hypothetical protein
MSNRKVIKTFDISATNKHLNGWSPASLAEVGTWYIALYMGDKTPYVLKFNGSYWRSSDDTLMAIPMYVFKIPSPPVVKQPKDE